jgi:hypothetical protein
VNIWEQIISELEEQTLVSIKLSPREAIVVQEALHNWADGVIAEAPAWQVAQLMTEFGWPWGKKSQVPKLRSNMTGGGEKAVKSLDPKEVEVVRSIVPNAKARQGDTGQIMALPPKEWERIKGEIEAKPDYYDKMLGNQVSASGLTKKIGDQLQLATGAIPGGKLKEPEMQVQHGSEQFGNQPASSIPAGPQHAQSEPATALDDFDVDFEEPAREPEQGFTPAASAKPKRSHKKKVAPAGAPVEDPVKARRRRVAAQDAALMGGKTEPKGKVRVK